MQALHVYVYYIRLFYSNEQVSNNNNEQLTKLEHPIAHVNARHSFKVHLFLYTMPSYVLTSIIVVKFGMYLVKYNLNGCKSSKIELLELFLA